jgi:DNA-directed RNA polymerase specialized sigma24 family protein
MSSRDSEMDTNAPISRSSVGCVDSPGVRPISKPGRVLYRMTQRVAKANYSRGEIEALVEGYEELVVQKDVDRKRRLRIVHGLLDLDAATDSLTQKQSQAIILMGRLGFSYRQAAELLRVEPNAMWERYQHALDRLTEIINRGGT